MLGIPFIFMVASWHFGIGLVSALFTRNIIPTITKWRRKLKEIQRTGTWHNDEPPSPDPNSRNHIEATNGLPNASPLNSPVLSNSTATEGKQGIFGVNPITDFVSRLIQWVYPVSNPGFVDETISMIALETVHEYQPELTPQEQFLQDLANAASNATGSQAAIENYADHKRASSPSLIFQDARSVQEESMAGFFSELASAASQQNDFTYKSQYKAKQKTPSLYSVPSVYRSVLDELADASELLEKENLSKVAKPTKISTKKLVGVNYSRVPISPDDSASQDGSDGLAISEINFTDNGDTTDAAKLLFMFGMERSSPQRPPVFPRNSSPERYFVPGLVN